MHVIVQGQRSTAEHCVPVPSTEAGARYVLLLGVPHELVHTSALPRPVGRLSY